MCTYTEDAFICEAERQSVGLIASSDASIKRCEKRVEKLDTKLEKADAHLEKCECYIAELKAETLFPSIYKAAKKLPEAELQLRYARWKLAEEVKEKEKVHARCLEATGLEYRTKQENKELKKTFDELTAELTGEVKAKERDEKAALMAEIATLKAQLTAQADENKMKDKRLLQMTKEMEKYKQSEEEKHEELLEFKKDVKAYQKASEEGYMKRQVANEAYILELEEVYVAATKQGEARELRLKEAELELKEMLEYANLAVTMANKAWCDGAEAIECLTWKASGVFEDSE